MPEVPDGPVLPALRDGPAAELLDLCGPWPPPPPHGRNDLPQVGHLGHLWFYAMYLMTSTRIGISAKQLERELGVTYKPAPRRFHLIRYEVAAQTDEPPAGRVELDELYLGSMPPQTDRATWAAPRLVRSA